MSWAEQQVSSSTDDMLEQNVSLSSHHTQQVSPICACTDVLHIWFVHIWALHFVLVHIGHKACVSSQMMQCLVSWDVHLNIITWCFWAYSLVLALRELVIHPLSLSKFDHVPLKHPHISRREYERSTVVPQKSGHAHRGCIRSKTTESGQTILWKPLKSPYGTPYINLQTSPPKMNRSRQEHPDKATHKWQRG